MTITWALSLAGCAMLLAATGVPAAAQVNPITNPGFEQVDAAGRPVDWEILGTGSVQTEDVRSGQRALRLVRTPETEGEVGLNRRWRPNSGEQGAMLAERRGGIRFWYKAVHAQPPDALTVQVIPMNDRPLEVGGKRVRWQVPASHIGDGQWRQGAFAYDFTDVSEVQWVHVSARLVGESGELLLDDFEWVEQVGPVLQSGGLKLAETPGREGQDATLTLTVRNLGDEALPPGLADVHLPPGLTVPEARATTPQIAPGETAEVAWAVSGRRDRIGDRIHVTAQAGEQTAEDALELSPRVTLSRLHTPRMIIEAGQDIPVQLLARNEGTAAARGFAAQLLAPDGVRVTPQAGAEVLDPGREGAVGAWTVSVDEPTPLVRLEARMEGAEDQLSLPLVVAPNLPRDVETEGAAYAFERDGQVVIGTDMARLVITQAWGGWSLAALQAHGPDGWRTVAYLPRLGLLATPAGEVALVGATASPRQEDGEASVVLTGEAAPGAANWQFRWEMSVEAGADTISYRMEATPDADDELLALEGPMIYAAEGGEPQRDDAILPGMEWLVEGEESSNALDFRPEHPDRIRYVPHPYKVTVPAVGMKIGDTTVGLLWDTPPRQPSHEQAGAASLVFASPNRFEGHDNHLMGLFLPAVREWVEENERRAARPLSVAAEETLVVQAEVLAAPGADDSLVALDRWFARHGYPEPLPFPRGDELREIEFSVQAYFKDRELWNPEWNQWYSDLIVGFRPTTGPATQLLWAAELVGEGEVAEESRRLAAEVLGDDERALALRLQHRANPDALLQQARQARALIASQHEDGTWRFSGKHAGDWPEEGVNYDVLGPEGASEVGLSARNAADVLHAAIITGDADMRAAGLKALEAMRQFRVPRAAQVWEVPVHTPDIYASAQAMRAYLAGYRLTGEQQYLDDAVYWARTGLPFVYVWHSEDQPDMLGATIPVFGATHYVLSWIAVAVQWNGLGYSAALYELADLDDSFPWRTVADNILRSAMYQQVEEGPRFGQWPDAVNFITPRPGLYGQTPPCFQPSTIIHQTLGTMGIRHAPEAVVARQGDEQLAIRGTATFEQIEWAGDALSFTARYTPPQRGAVEIIAVTRPTRVSLDREALSEREDMWEIDAPSWRWHEAAAVLEVRLTEPGEHRLVIEGARRADVAFAPPLLREIDFRFTDDAQGWVALHHLAPFTFRDGLLHTVTTGHDPYMGRDGLYVEGTAGDVLVLRLAATGGGEGGSVFWATADAPGYSPAREIRFTFPSDGTIQEARVPVGEHEAWAGRAITALRVDPGGGVTGATVQVESIRLER